MSAKCFERVPKSHDKIICTSFWRSTQIVRSSAIFAGDAGAGLFVVATAVFVVLRERAPRSATLRGRGGAEGFWQTLRGPLIEGSAGVLIRQTLQGRFRK